MTGDGNAREDTQLVVLASYGGRHLGERHRLDPEASPITLGRGAENALVFEADGISRRHAHFEFRTEGWWIVDDDSTNGTWLDEARVFQVPLRLGDRIRVGDIVFEVTDGRERPAMDGDPNHPLSVRDGLTGLLNKRGMLEVIERALHHPKRVWHPLSVAMFDIDGFRRVNDEFGFSAGDEVLRAVASHLRRVDLQNDEVARYGGDAFVWLMRRTGIDDAVARANAAGRAIAAHVITVEQCTISVTVSAGVVQADERTPHAEDLVRLARDKLDEGESAGRGRIVR